MPEASTPSSRRRSPKRPRSPEIHDVLIVGGGPAGSSCAYWLAEAGWDVVLVEKKHFPREKTCGDGLTPRSVRQLEDMGLGGALSGAHRYDGLRACAYGRELELRWPEHPAFASYGYVITRHDLDGLVAERAAKAGADVRQGTVAVAPLEPNDPPPQAGKSLSGCAGAVVKSSSDSEPSEIRAKYVVVADGANSRFGRALGAQRTRQWPMGMALRGYYRSPAHDDTFIESHLDIRDASGTIVPGYGWIFPLGDGRVNVGVGILSVEGRWRGINTSRLMDSFINWAPRRWALSPEAAVGQPTGGKLPMGMSVGPRVGPNVVAIGDAGGSINPFNGEGIAYGYETGRLAAASVGHALAEGTPDALLEYEQRLQDAYGMYFQVARDFVRMISHPRIMQICVRCGMRSGSLMDGLLRIMANLMRPGTPGAAEAAYAGLAQLSNLLGNDRAAHGA